MKEFSENLKTLRESRNVSKSELARLLNMAPSAYSPYETGTKNIGDREPNLTNLVKLADFFNVSTDELLNHKVDKLDKLEYCKNLWESAGFKVQTEKMNEKFFEEHSDYFPPFSNDSIEEYLYIKVTWKNFFEGVTLVEGTVLEFFKKRDFIELTLKIEKLSEEKATLAFRNYLIKFYHEKARHGLEREIE